MSMRSLLLAAGLMLSACEQSPNGSSNGAYENSAGGEAVFSSIGGFQTGRPVTGISVVPAIGHRGQAILAVAHGQSGVAVYKLDGEVIWSDDKPADLAVFSDGKLLVYRKGSPEDSVDVYARSGNSLFELSETRSPPIPAATTLQRTALAEIGPARIEGKEINLVNHGRLKAEANVTAVAGVNGLIPLTGGATVIYADDAGAIHIAEIGPAGAGA